MPDDLSQTPDIDPITGSVPLDVGSDVVVADELGEKRSGVITSITDGTTPLYTVLVEGGPQEEVTVAEDHILARIIEPWEC